MRKLAKDLLLNLLERRVSAEARKHWIILLVSFLLATTLWFLLTLNQSYDTILTYPVQVINYPEGFQPVAQRPAFVEVRVEGHGGDLFVKQFQQIRDTLRIPFREDFQQGYFLPQRYLTQIDRELGMKFRIRQVLTDTVYYPFERQTTKRVKLVPQVDVQLAPGVALFSAPIVIPESVTVVGPQQVLDTILQWHTRPFTTPRLTRPQEFQVQVPDTSSLLQVTPREARLFINPELYTQVKLKLPVSIIDIPDRTRVRLQDDSVTVNLLVPMERYENLQARVPEIRLSFGELDPSIPFFIPDIQNRLPAYVRLIGREPLQIRYVIIRDKT